MKPPSRRGVAVLIKVEDVPVVLHVIRPLKPKLHRVGFQPQPGSGDLDFQSVSLHRVVNLTYFRPVPSTRGLFERGLVTGSLPVDDKLIPFPAWISLTCRDQK